MIDDKIQLRQKNHISTSALCALLLCSITRSFIALLFFQNGWQLTIADKKAASQCCDNLLNLHRKMDRLISILSQLCWMGGWIEQAVFFFVRLLRNRELRAGDTNWNVCSNKIFAIWHYMHWKLVDLFVVLSGCCFVYRLIPLLLAQSSWFSRVALFVRSAKRIWTVRIKFVSIMREKNKKKKKNDEKGTSSGRNSSNSKHLHESHTTTHIKSTYEFCEK